MIIHLSGATLSMLASVLMAQDYVPINKDEPCSPCCQEYDYWNRPTERDTMENTYRLSALNQLSRYYGTVSSEVVPAVPQTFPRIAADPSDVAEQFRVERRRRKAEQFEKRQPKGTQ